jgi:hypothetical protein
MLLVAYCHNAKEVLNGQRKQVVMMVLNSQCQWVMLAQ